jgi:hypothetical protein
VNLLSLHYQRDVMFGTMMSGIPQRAGNAPLQPTERPEAPRPVPVTNIQFHMQLQVAAEPRLAVSPGGTVQVTEATDDLGNSLTEANSSNNGGVPNRPAPFIGGGHATPMIQMIAPLVRPQKPGSTIKVIRGLIPLSASARRADPLVIPLAGAENKTFEGEETSVVIHSVKTQANNRQTAVELTIRSTDDSSADGEAGEPIPGRPGIRPDVVRQRIEIVDSEGHTLPWFQTMFDAASSRMTLTLAQAPTVGEPKELRVYSITRTQVEIPFEFRDLPMP